MEVVDDVDIDNLLKKDIFRIMGNDFQYFGFCWNGNKNKFVIDINCRFGDMYCSDISITIIPFENMRKSDIADNIIGIIDNYCSMYLKYYNSRCECYVNELENYVELNCNKQFNDSDLWDYTNNVLSKLSLGELVSLYQEEIENNQ